MVQKFLSVFLILVINFTFLFSQSNTNNLRYKGMYTISGEKRSLLTGEYKNKNKKNTDVEIKIYDNYILVGNKRCNYVDTDEFGSRMYNSDSFEILGFTITETYFVKDGYNIELLETYNSDQGLTGSEIYEYKVTKKTSKPATSRRSPKPVTKSKVRHR